MVIVRMKPNPEHRAMSAKKVAIRAMREQDSSA
jgi:hypothetical protein